MTQTAQHRTPDEFLAAIRSGEITPANDVYRPFDGMAHADVDPAYLSPEREAVMFRLYIDLADRFPQADQFSADSTSEGVSVNMDFRDSTWPLGTMTKDVRKAMDDMGYSNAEVTGYLIGEVYHTNRVRVTINVVERRHGITARRVARFIRNIPADGAPPKVGGVRRTPGTHRFSVRTIALAGTIALCALAGMAAFVLARPAAAQMNMTAEAGLRALQRIGQNTEVLAAIAASRLQVAHEHLQAVRATMVWENAQACLLAVAPERGRRTQYWHAMACDEFFNAMERAAPQTEGAD